MWDATSDTRYQTNFQTISNKPIPWYFNGRDIIIMEHTAFRKWYVGILTHIYVIS